MNLYIKQKAFSWGEKFTVKDALNNDRYTVAGEVFSWGKKLHIYDMQGREVAYIKQEVWSWLPRYYVYCGENKIAEIKKEMTFLRPKYKIEGLDWNVNGNFLAHEYSISQGNRQIIGIKKAWMSWGDSYELNIIDDAHEIIGLAVVLTIDCVLASNK